MSAQTVRRPIVAASRNHSPNLLGIALIGLEIPLRAAVLAAVSAGLSFAALALLQRFAARLPYAYANDRSLHAHPVPRIGGLAILAGGLVGAAIDPPAGIAAAAWLPGVVAVALVSLVDDWHGVAPAMRLAVHGVASAAAVAGLALVPSGAMPTLVGSVAAVIAIAWSANLFNFMDGSDGLAALMAACGFGALGFAAALGDAPSGASFAMAASALTFLAVNAPPARMFMGDVGAVPLGFLAACWGIAGIRAGIYPAWFVPLVFMPFWSDASVTLARRVVRRERIFEAHRSHYYQRLHRLGAGHRGTLLCFGVLMLGTGGSALGALAFAPETGWLILGTWFAIHAAVFTGIEYHWRKRCLPVQ